jgi:small subunit ribosomal protein S17
MADEQDKEMSDEQQPEETAAVQAAAPEQRPEPVEATPEPVAEPSEPEAQAAQEPEPDAQAAQEPEPAQAPEPAQPAARAAAPAEPVEQLSSKERRRKARSLHVGSARAPRTPEERQAERDAARRTKAVKRRGRRLQERAKRAEHRASTPAAQPLAPVHPPREGAGRMRQGVVVSNKADKTITVRIDVARRHRRYEKIVRSSSTLHAHDENNDAHEGDVVRVIESRPLSRTKRWRLVDVLERAR